jgi:hypothetical protein
MYSYSIDYRNGILFANIAACPGAIFKIVSAGGFVDL